MVGLAGPRLRDQDTLNFVEPLLPAELGGFGPVPHLPEAGVYSPDHVLRLVPELMGDGVQAYGRAAIERLEARGAVRLPEDPGPDVPSCPKGLAPQSPALLAKGTNVVVRDAVRQWTEELERRLRGIRTVADWDDAHAARISVKRIRYVLKPFKRELAPASNPGEALSAAGCTRKASRRTRPGCRAPGGVR
jgi:hypothetical protein